MFDLILTLCLAGEPANCIERRAPVERSTLSECHERGPITMNAFHEGGQIVRSWRCTTRGGEIELLPHTHASMGKAVLTQIAEGVFVHTGQHETPSADNHADLSNIGVIIGEESVALIDTGGSAHVARKVLEQIRAKTDLPISHVILTHMHPDHVLGAKVFADEGARILGHHKLEAALAARAEGYETNIRRLIGDAAFEGSKVIGPDEAVEQSLRIDLGARSLVLEAHPTAHTDNDLTVFDEKTGTWFLGDLLFLDHLPAIDGSLLGWQALMEELSTRKAARAVPGHGPASVEWPEGGEPLRVYLETIANETRAAIKEGKTLHEATMSVGQSFAQDWLLFDEFNARNVTTAYQELEWE